MKIHDNFKISSPKTGHILSKDLKVQASEQSVNIKQP